MSICYVVRWLAVGKLQTVLPSFSVPFMIVQRGRALVLVMGWALARRVPIAGAPSSSSTVLSLGCHTLRNQKD